MYSLRDIDLRKEVEIEPFKQEGSIAEPLHYEGCPTIIIPAEQVPYFVGDIRDADGLDGLLGELSALCRTQSTEFLTAYMPIEWLRGVWDKFTERPLSEAWAKNGCNFVAIHFERLRDTI